MIVTAVQLADTAQPKPDTLAAVIAHLAAARGSDLVLLPELWPTGYFNFDRYPADAEPIDGPLVTTLREQARVGGFHLFTGSFVERDGGRLFNTALLINPAGQIVGRYRKMHLFGYQSRERQLLSPGDGVTVVDTPWGRAGLSTCYDLRFPEQFRAMLDRGAELFLVTAAWPAARADAWTLFQRARAHENLACLFSANMAGGPYAGHSLFIDPTGAILADAGPHPTVLTRELDPSAVATTRQAFPALVDRVMKAPS